MQYIPISNELADTISQYVKSGKVRDEATFAEQALREYAFKLERIRAYEISRQQIEQGQVFPLSELKERVRAGYQKRLANG